MTKIIDFSNCELSPRNLEYGGRAGEKKGIVYKNSFWFLKFPKSTLGMDKINGLSYVTSPLSEYIGSHIYKILGYDVHDTELGICFDGKRFKLVCACKDFIIDDKNELLIPYTALRNDTKPELMEKRDSSLFGASNINEIIFQLDNNTVLSNIPNAKERFWDVVVIDMLINNNDRNNGNWGLLYDGEGLKIAPVFDNGSSFSNKLPDEKLLKIFSSEERMLVSSLGVMTAFGKDGRSYSFQELIKIGMNHPEFVCALKRNVPLIRSKMNDIIAFVECIPGEHKGIDVCSQIRKNFYIKAMMLRLDHILVPALQQALNIKPSLSSVIKSCECKREACIHKESPSTSKVQKDTKALNAERDR